MTSETNFLSIAQQIGELVEQKNAAYGSSFAKTGDFLRLLYPDGIVPEKYDDALLLVRVFDKQMRIATDRDALGESPWCDIAGYGILGSTLHVQRGNNGKGEDDRDLSQAVPAVGMQERSSERRTVLHSSLPDSRLEGAEHKQPNRP